MSWSPRVEAAPWYARQTDIHVVFPHNHLGLVLAATRGALEFSSDAFDHCGSYREEIYTLYRLCPERRKPKTRCRLLLFGLAIFVFSGASVGRLAGGVVQIETGASR